MRAAAGAIASFIGIVRGDGGLSSMTLDHYPGMCESEIAAHVEEARKRWPILGVADRASRRRVVPGDRIVFVGVASAHRQAAFRAAEFLMDYLKTRAPFWKLERRGGKRKRGSRRASKTTRASSVGSNRVSGPAHFGGIVVHQHFADLAGFEAVRADFRDWRHFSGGAGEEAFGEIGQVRRAEWHARAPEFAARPRAPSLNDA